MRGAFVVGIMAGAALGALIVLASQEQNRKIVIVQAGRLADQARSLMNTNKMAAVANNVVEAATEMVGGMGDNMATGSANI
jgi:hypothetical protein